MAIYFIDHAEERFFERGISLSKIREMLNKGVIIEDISSKIQRKICIYKEQGEKYYSIVFQKAGIHIFIITAYPSKEWEIRVHKEKRK